MNKQLELAAFYRQLGTMLNAGLSILQALDSLERSAPSGRLRTASVQLRDRIRSGSTVAESVKAYPALFPVLHCELMDVGERSGSLDRILKHLAELLEQFARIRKEVWSRMLYPLVVLHLSLFLGPLPQLVMDRDMAAYGGRIFRMLLFCYGGVGMIGWMIRQISRHRAMVEATDRLILALPAIGKIHRDLSLGRFCMALRTMLSAGIGILEAVPRAGAVCNSASLAASAAAAVPALKEGTMLGVAMADRFPSDAMSMLVTGQQSGKLDQMLEHLEKMFFDEGQRRLNAMANWLPKLIYFGAILWAAWWIIQMALGYRNILMQAMEP